MGLNRSRKERASGARQWIGNLLVAWTFVAGLALTFASAWYYRTGDLESVIAWLGAPALVGAALFLALGLLSLVAREKPREVVEADGIRARKQREGWFGR